MRILQVNKFFYGKGGSEAYLFSLMDGMRDRGHTLAEFAMDSPRNRPSRWSEFFVSEIDYETERFLEKVRIAAKIVYSFEARRKIGNLLDRFRPDIAHLHIFQHQLSPSILPEIRRRGIPILYTAHDLKSVCPNYRMLTHGQVCERCRSLRYYNCLLHTCVKNSRVKSAVNTVEMYLHSLMGYYSLIDLTVTPSEHYRRKLVSYRFPREKVIHVPNFVNEDLFLPSYAHDGYILYLGRLAEEKGVLTLVEAMRHVTRNVELLIVGTGPLEEEVARKAERTGLSNVRLAGYRSGGELRKIIARSMFTVLPSEWYENGPIALLESFASGKPVIGSDMGGIPEHIDDGVDGFIFRAGDAEALADKINALAASPSLPRRMGKAARDKVEKRFSRAVHLDRMESLYTRLRSAEVA